MLDTIKNSLPLLKEISDKCSKFQWDEATLLSELLLNQLVGINETKYAHFILGYISMLQGKYGNALDELLYCPSEMTVAVYLKCKCQLAIGKYNDAFSFLSFLVESGESSLLKGTIFSFQITNADILKLRAEILNHLGQNTNASSVWRAAFMEDPTLLKCLEKSMKWMMEPTSLDEYSSKLNHLFSDSELLLKCIILIGNTSKGLFSQLKIDSFSNVQSFKASLAYSYAERHMFVEAKEMFEEVLGERYSYTYLMEHYINTLFHLKDSQRLSELAGIWKSYPDSSFHSWLAYSTIFSINNDQESALKTLCVASDLNHLSPIPDLLMGCEYLTMGEYEDACERFRCSLRIDHNSSKALYLFCLQYLTFRLGLGISYYRMCNFADAEKILLMVARMRPEDYVCFNYLTSLYLSEYKRNPTYDLLEKAEEMVNLSILNSRNDRKGKYLYCIVLYEKGIYDECLKNLSLLQREGCDEELSVLLLVARCSLKLGCYEVGRGALGFALEIEPNNNEANGLLEKFSEIC